MNFVNFRSYSVIFITMEQLALLADLEEMLRVGQQVSSIYLQRAVSNDEKLHVS